MSPDRRDPGKETRLPYRVVPLPAIDPEAADRWWAENLPRASALYIEHCRVLFSDRWLRIHQLDEGKRNPETIAEARGAIDRHITVLERLFEGVSSVWVSSCT